MMKKASLASALIATVALAGCADPDGDIDQDDDMSVDEEASAVEDAPEGLEPDFEGIDSICDLVPDSYAEGVAEVAVNPDVPPVKFVDEDGDITGLTVQLVTAAGQLACVETEMVQASFDGLIPGITGERYDMILSIGAFSERQEHVDFIDYMTQSSTLTVRPGSEFENVTPDTLCGLRVAFTTGTQEDGLIETENANCEDQGEEPIDAVPYGEAAATFLALDSGQTDVIWGDSTPAYFNEAQDPDSYTIVHADFVGPYGTAFRKDEEGEQLREAFHQAMLHLVEEGWYEELFDSWGMTEQMLPELPINSGGSIEG